MSLGKIIEFLPHVDTRCLLAVYGCVLLLLWLFHYFKCANSEYVTGNAVNDRDLPVDKLKDVKVADALKHPNWNMGKKITVDSATLFNKVISNGFCSALFFGA